MTRLRWDEPAPDLTAAQLEMIASHENHEIMVRYPHDFPTPGDRYGPVCLSCSEPMIEFVWPGPDDMEKVRQWVVDHPEVLARVTC